MDVVLVSDDEVLVVVMTTLASRLGHRMRVLSPDQFHFRSAPVACPGVVLVDCEIAGDRMKAAAPWIRRWRQEGLARVILLVERSRNPRTPLERAYRIGVGWLARSCDRATVVRLQSLLAHGRRKPEEANEAYRSGEAPNSDGVSARL